MVTYYYKNSHSKITEVLTDYKPGTWVCVEEPTPEEVDALVEKFKLDPGHLEDVLDAEEMPRLEQEGELTYIFIRYAYTNDDLELATSPLLFIIGKDVFISVALHKLPRLQRFVENKLNFDTIHHSRLLILIMHQIVEQYEVFINNISRQIKVIRTRLRNHTVGNQDFIDFVLIEDELNDFLSALLPTNAILRRLMLGRSLSFTKEDQDLMEDLLLNNEQSIEGCKSNVKSIVNIREAYATISSNNLNRTMKILTAATVLITLPNVIFSMYGMNMHAPFQSHKWSFGAVALTSVLITIIVAIVARARRIF